VGESSDSVETAPTGQGPTLVGVQEAKGARGGGKTKSRKSFDNFGDSFELSLYLLFFSFFFFFFLFFSFFFFFFLFFSFFFESCDY